MQYVYIFFIHSCSVFQSYLHAFMFISSPYCILYMQVAAITLLLFFSKNLRYYLSEAMCISKTNIKIQILICCPRMFSIEVVGRLS